MKLFFYAYKSWGHDPIWYFSCLCRKFSELRALLFLSSTQTSQNLKFIQKCPCLSSLKNKFQWTQKKFWPLIRKILIWTFWDYKSSWSKKSTPIQPGSVIGAPLLCIFKRCNSGMGMFRPFLQRSLPCWTDGYPVLVYVCVSFRFPLNIGWCLRLISKTNVTHSKV